MERKGTVLKIEGARERRYALRGAKLLRTRGALTVKHLREETTRKKQQIRESIQDDLERRGLEDTPVEPSAHPYAESHSPGPLLSEAMTDQEMHTAVLEIDVPHSLVVIEGIYDITRLNALQALRYGVRRSTARQMLEGVQIQ